MTYVIWHIFVNKLTFCGGKIISSNLILLKITIFHMNINVIKLLKCNAKTTGAHIFHNNISKKPNLNDACSNAELPEL